MGGLRAAQDARGRGMPWAVAVVWPGFRGYRSQVSRSAFVRVSLGRRAYADQPLARRQRPISAVMSEERWLLPQ
ncbi:hypothetical protein ADK34_02525 [Streptomyces viridochromogenes]|uniref:Uncharacterized protein n=1 Tax=Streptomyces viridochromogenes TaxID=1938 RepID=A0A0L8LE03_STRVR|nr:hypothetical protein ADK34_02525 [Streptomyces viridochromogenes]